MAQLIRAAFVAVVLLLPRVAVVAQWRASRRPPPPPPPTGWWEPYEDFTFSTNTFAPFMDELMEQVSLDAKARFENDRISVQPVQRTGARRGTWRKPELWYFVNLVEGAPEAFVRVLNRAQLAIRTDNFYVVGFANKRGRWHVLKEGEGLIPNAVRLGFYGDYHELVGGSRNLHELLLGKDATEWARRVLADFDAGTSDVAQLKTALAILVVSICEAARFPDIRALIEHGWDRGAYFTNIEEKYVVNWLTFSCAILAYQLSHDWWRSTDAQDLRKYLKINSKDEAQRKVNMVLQSRNCKSAVRVYN